MEFHHSPKIVCGKFSRYHILYDCFIRFVAEKRRKSEKATKRKVSGRISAPKQTKVNLQNRYSAINTYARISATTPEPTVLPPSRIAKRSPFSQAIGEMSSTVISTLSPGRHISTPSGSSITPVTSVVLK